MADFLQPIILSAALLGAVIVQTAHSASLPCNHPLRLSAPELFKHCGSSSGCSYSSWTNWQPVPNSVVSVSKTQCPSGKAYQEKRTRTNTGPTTCNVLSETKQVCLPDQEDRLILALGLGGSGQNYRPVSGGKPTPRTGGGGRKLSRISYRRVSYQPKRCPANNNNGRICQHLVGKRSASLIDEFSPVEKIVDEESAPLDETPEPFDWNEHGPRLRRHVQTCNANEIQHVLFVLDSSGSIGGAQYQRMKNAIGKLVPLFCKQVKFAMVTFSTNINLEFCFNCFQNTYHGRSEAKKAVEKAKYHNRGTNTGATTKCICDNLLSISCGISSNPSCLDVVYITDGRSNDYTHKVCKEVKCLHKRTGINTYAIGINNFVQSELDCISHSSNILSAFQFNSFTAFEKSIDNIINRVKNSILNGSTYSCLQRNNKISPTGSVPFGR